VYINAATPPSADWSTSIQPSAFGFSPIGLGLPDVHASTGPMDKWFLINQLLAFRARERHARQPPEQKIESTLTGRKLVRIPLWTFFLLRTRPPSPDDHPERVWVMPHHTRTPWTMRKLERRASRASELARRRADRGNADFYVAPRTSFRVLGPRRLRSARNNSPGTPTDTKGPPTTTVVFNVSQNPPSGQLGPWGAKKEQKDSHNERS